MAQLPDSNNKNNNNINLMDEEKVNPNPYIDDNYNDNDSMNANPADVHDIMDDNSHHAIINNRADAPEPPSTGLTVESLQHFNNQHDPQSMLEATLGQNSNSVGGNSSNPIPNLFGSNNGGSGIADMLGINHGVNDLPKIMIDQLVDMGFDRKRVIYALHEAEKINGLPSVDFALTWLCENPNFIPPDTDDIIGKTVQNFIGHGLDTTNINNNVDKNNHNKTIDPSPPNNSPAHRQTDDPFTKPIATSKDDSGDNFIYKLIEQTANNHNITKSKSNRIYNNSATLHSASTEEEKNGTFLNTNNSHKNTKHVESKNDEDVDDFNTNLYDNQATQIHHQQTTSTVTSEISQLSGIRSTSPSINDNTNNNKTKQQIHSLYNNLPNDNKYDHAIPNDLKMVIVVRKDLKMSSGKVAAQCCHGCLGVVLSIINNQHIRHLYNNNNNNNFKVTYDLNKILTKWRNVGEKKIVLQCENEKKLLELKDQCAINNLPYHLVTDAGHTQIKAGSKTVLAIGPYLSDKINLVTASLKLY